MVILGHHRIADNGPILPLNVSRRIIGVEILKNFTRIRIYRYLLDPGQANRHQLVTDNRFAIQVCAHCQKAVDSASIAVHQVSIRAKLEIAHPGQGQAFKAGGVGGVNHIGHVFISYQKESISIEHTVHRIARGKVAGGHIQVNARHLGAVSDLGGIFAAHRGGTIGPTAIHGIQRIPKYRALGFIAVGVHVCDIVSDYAQLVHMGFHTRNRRVHCSSHVFA